MLLGFLEVVHHNGDDLLVIHLLVYHLDLIV